VVVLAQHWPQAAHLPVEPLEHVGAIAQFRRQKLPGLLGQVLQNGPRLKHTQGLATVGGFVVNDGGNAVVGGNGEKIWGKLFALANVDGLEAVGQGGLFEKNGDLVAVGGRPVVQVDHRMVGLSWGTPGQNLLQV
jgi:hypothetical protein